MIGNLICKLFICSCNANHGIKNIKEFGESKIVGRCLKCNKRVYGFLYNYNIQDIQSSDDRGNDGSK